MTARSVVAVLGAVLLALTGCKPQPGQQPHPGAQPEAPAADPGPNNTSTAVVLKVAWVGERTGSIEVSINGQVQPKFRADRPSRLGSGRYYTGAWEHTYQLAGVRQIGFTWFPDHAGMSAQCSIWHEGIVVDAHGIDTGPCAVSWSR